MTDRADALTNLQRLRALLAGDRDIPRDLRFWLLNGFTEFEDTGDLAGALGIRLTQGRRFNGASLLTRAEMERSVLRVADLIGPRNGATAALIVRALDGEVGHVPTIAIDFLRRAQRNHRIHGAPIPRSRNAITRILTGQTRAGLWGLTSTR